jgi:anaerobic selenocysteine-containing dehydrogenase
MDPDDVLRTTCPRDCYDACGIEVLRRDGRIRVRGDREHPISRGRLCRKCTVAFNGVLLDPDARLTRPMRRVGPKGSGQFEPISWEDALEETAAALGAVVDRLGPQAVLNAHYTGTFSVLAFLFPQRFFTRLGATEVDPDSVCNKAGHMALRYTYGDSLEGFDPRTIRDSACVLVWGANPSASAPHQHEHWLGETDATVIVVDPIRTRSAAAADLHLQPKPGTDAALAFAILHVIDRDGLTDATFLAEHVDGWNAMRADVRRSSPEWAQSVCGVPIAAIEEAARIYAAGPSLLWIGQGLQRQPLGGNIVRAVGALPAVTGNLLRPGTGFLYLNGFGNRRLDEDWLVAGSGELAPGPPPAAVSHMDLVDTLNEPGRAGALCCWNINIAQSNPRQAALRAAISRADLFVLAVDVFPTDTTDLADIVLPAASFLEFDDLVASYFHRSLSVQQQVMEPPGEALPNTEIFRRLAAAMGYTDPDLFVSDRELIDELLRRTGYGIDFRELARVGTIWPSPEPEIQFADGKFATPSGRIELASSSAAADGLPAVAGPFVDAPLEAGILRLLSPSSEWTLNGSYANDPSIGRRLGPATVTVHPDEAASRGLIAGSPVILRNAEGELAVDLALDDAVPCGVAYAPKGRWPRQETSGANVNALNSGEKTDMGGSSAVHGVRVSLVAAPSQPGPPRLAG